MLRGRAPARRVMLSDGTVLDVGACADTEVLTRSGTTLVGSAGGGGGGAPTGASYVVLGTDATLTSERVATAGTGITLTDAGAGSTLTLAIDTAWVGQAAITTVGTITTGVWNGTAISAPRGGTGQTAYTTGDLLYASGTSALATLAAGTSGYVLTSGGAGVAPAWAAVAGAASTFAAQSSGVLTGGTVSIGTGGAGVATTFTIASGTGQIVDNTVSPSTVTAVSWSTQTDVAVTNILTQLVTFLAIDSGGSVVQSSTDFTPAQQREYVVIGVAVHSNQTTVNAVNQTQIVAYAPGAQVNDLMYGLGLFNVSGNVFSANGANLKLNKSAGSLFRRGANYTSLTDNPHVKATASLTQVPLRMQNQTGAGSASTTDVDVANYDLAGVTTAISPGTRFSILRVYLFQSNLVAVQRGQATYQSLAEAKAAIQTETFVTNAIVTANGLLRGFIVAQANASSLSDAGKVFLIEAGKFGGSSGVGGLSVSTLQNAYDNSSTPEVLTDSTRGAVTIRRGSGADTDAVIEVQSGAGATTFSVTGAGAVSAGTWNGAAIGATYGGTGQTAYTTGDLLYASGTSALATLAAGTSGYVLTSGGAGVAPAWAAAAAHASTHKSGGSDAIRLDELAAPTASVGFNDQQATSFRVENRTGDPGTPTVGQIWLRTDL